MRGPSRHVQSIGARKAVLLLTLVGSGIAVFCPAAEPRWGANLITEYRLQSIGGSGTAWVSIQDIDGTMYFGCDSVLRFDGEHWTAHAAGRATVLRGLAIDSERRLWVGARGDLGYFTLTPDGPRDFVSLRELVPKDIGPIEDIWVVAATPQGVFFAETDSVLRWNGRELQAWPMPGSRRLNLFYSDGQVLLNGARGVMRFNGSDWDTVIPVSLTRPLGIEWIEAAGDKYLLGTWIGFHEFSRGELRTVPAPVARQTHGEVLADVCRYDADSIAAAVIGRGIVLLDPDGTVQRELGAAEGITDVETNSVFVDRDGAIWTTTRNHIARISPALGISYFGAQHGVHGPAESLTEFNGRILIATNAGLALLDEEGDGPLRRFALMPNLRGDLGPVKAMGEGKLLIAGFDTLFISDGLTHTPIPLNGRDVESIHSSANDPGRFFLLSSGGGAWWKAGMPLTRIPEFPVNPLMLCEDRAGNLWIGTRTQGLAVLRPDKGGYARTDAPAGLPDDMTHVRTTLVGPHILACGEERSFVSIGPGAEFREIAELRGSTIEATHVLPNDEGTWVLVARPGVKTSRHLVAARMQSAGARVTLRYHEIPGIDRIGTPRDIYVQARPGESCLWISGTGGVLRVPVDALGPPTPPRQPLLRARFPEEENRPSREGRPILPFRANRLSFDWAVTDYERRHQLLFQTRLVGLEAGWSAPQAASRREFPFLQEGDYRFEVRTLSPAGLASPAAVWDFTILPPWWRTRGAYAGYALAAALLFIGADRVRIRALRRRTEWLEEQVRARTAELEKANAAKTEFVARVNHDIRNPINGVLGLTLTLEQTPLNDEQRRLTGTIRQCAQFLSSLVEEVLDFAEIESGAIRIRSDRFDLRAAVAASIATIDPLARQAGSPVEADLDPTLPPQLGGDSPRVQQILVNFLSNAVKFGAGRPITVAARALHQIGPRLFVRLSVRDHGPGLSPEEQSQLFRKFSRLRFAEEHKIKGTGLGLAVCRLLAERLGGRVGVESTLGAGAEFFLEIPFDLVAAAADSGRPSPVATNARVLVVEDEDYNAIALLAMLKGMGFAAERCADGLSALAQLQRERYDIVFLDWELPRLNGIEVARRYRATEPPDRRALIIATTAYASADKRAACREAGMDEFVAKPVTPEQITIAIRGHASVFTPATSILVREETAASGPDLSLFAYLADGAGGVEAKVDEFIAACERELGELGSFAAAGRADELRRAAHRFLSQCRFVGATRLAGLALDLEQRSEQPRGPEVRSLLEALRAEFAAFKTELRSSLDARAAAEPAPSRSQNG